MEKVNPLIIILHAAFAPERAMLLERVRAGVGSHECMVWNDRKAQGSLGPYLEAMRFAVTTNFTHIVCLPDDAILPTGFAGALRRAIESKPDEVLCFQSNHSGADVAWTQGASWYTTTDGFTGFGGTFPKALLVEFLAWYDASVEAPGVDAHGSPCGANADEAVNLWAISTGRRIYKALPSLVDHDLGVRSLDGHEAQNEDGSVLRKPVVFADDANAVTYDGPTVHLGRTYTQNHWALPRKVRPEAWDLEKMYDVHRGGSVSSTPHVMIAVPVYGEPAAIVQKTDPSRERVIDDLLAHGIEASLLKTPGDSLVQRMRQRVCHAFMKTAATHLLWWDADIECLTPDCVRKMLVTGHDVIAGAYPFKDTTGRVVCNIRQSDYDAGKLTVHGGCLEVNDAGTGFMLVSRKAHVTLMQAHPELLHFSAGTEDRNEPLWALYDTAIHQGVLLSEDYQFCRLWQGAGGAVQIYVPARFKHWGLYGYEATLQGQYGLEAAP